MKITHHPEDASIMAYAAGTLDEAFAVLVSCHLEACPECREKRTAMEQVGGECLASVEDAPLSDGAFGRVLEKINAGQSKKEPAAIRSGGKAAEVAGEHAVPRALKNYLDGNLRDRSWKRVAPGVWQELVNLSEGSQSSLRLLKIASGRKVPEHGHGGQEMTLILRGAYEDEIGHFGPGDVADLDEHIEHQPKVVSDEACICLAATEAPTKFKSLASRILQPLIGI